MNTTDRCLSGCRYLQMILLLSLCGIASAGPIDIDQSYDTPTAFRTAIYHGPISTDATHAFGGGTNWLVAAGINENDELNFPGDEFQISGGAHHVIAPHGEGAGTSFSFEFDVKAIQHPEQIPSMPPITAKFPHGGHYDHYKALAAFSIQPFEQIMNYMVLIMGKHTFFPTLRSTQGALSGAQQVFPIPTSAFGVVGMFVDPTTGLFDLSLAAHGITPADLTAAHIHLGQEGLNGPVIFDLNAATFTALGTTGIVYTIEDAQFPLAYLDALLRGDTYVNLHTTANPDGEIRAQLVPEPTTSLLAAIALAALAVRGKFRALAK